MSQKFSFIRPTSIILRVISAIIALVLMLILALPIGFYGMAMYIEPSLPSTSELRTMPLEMPLQIYTTDNKLIGQYGNVYSLPITYSEMPQKLIQAFLAAEDDSFFEHSGISVKGLGRAITQMATDNGQQTGGSTITQQVAKNYFLTSEQTFERKLTELFLARRIEKELSKNEIMTLYVNKIYLGQGAYGIKAGAKRYYNKELDELSISEMAMLAGLPKAPSDFNPVVNPKRALERRNWILGRMLAQNYITQEDYQSAIDTDINLNMYQERLDYNMPYIAEMARTALVDKYGEHVMNSGWRVQLTVDSQNQLTAEQALVDGLKEYDKRHGWRGVEAEEGDVTQLVSYHNMHPAKVTEVTSSGFEATLNTGKNIFVPWSKMRWARRYHNVNYVGGGYVSPAQMVKAGNIVRVSPTKDDEWQLVQVPDAQGALVSISPQTGAIKALVGGFNFYHNKFNRATQGYRQPGSIIKPLIYAAGIENKKYTPDSILEDSPLKIGDWQPKNADGSFRGAMTMRQALAVSRNIPVIRAYLGTGTAKVHALLSNFGLERERLPEGAALALGAADATPLQMATAYATFANGGHRVQPYFIERIYDFHNNLIYQANIEHACALCFNSSLDKTNEKLLKNFEKTSILSNDAPSDEGILADINPVQTDENTALAVMPLEQTNTNTPPVKTAYRLVPKSAPQYSVAAQAPRIIAAQTAYDMADMLKGVITSGTGRRALAIGRPDIGGKTGTTNDAKDAWFAGIHPTAATVVWIGFDDPKTLGAREFGGVAALPVWVDYMKSYLEDKPQQWVDAKNHAESETQTQKIVNLTDDTPIEELVMTDDDTSSFDVDGEIVEGGGI